MAAGTPAAASSRAVSVIVPSIRNAFFAETVSTLQAELGKEKIQVLLGHTEYSEREEENLVRAALSWSPAAIVRELPKGRGKDLGGGELAREFLKADLIDELHPGIVPRLVGEGIPLFPSGFPQPDFSLVENKTYSRGMIALKYRRVRSKGKRKS